MMMLRVRRNRERGRALRCIVVLLCALPLLAGCGGGSSENNAAPAVTALTPLTPLPTGTATAELPDRLHLRPIAPNALTLFIQPDDGCTPVLDTFNNARMRIDLMIYLLSDREAIMAL